MPDYIVKTINDRNLVIEADYYTYNAILVAYEFFKSDTRRVATIPCSPEILAIVKVEAQKADFYYVDDWNQEDEEGDPEDEDDEDCDETCLDCRLDEFVGSATFFDAVWSILDLYLSPTDTEAEQPAEEYPIEHWKDKNGIEWWGFWTPEGFVNGYSPDFAMECRDLHLRELKEGITTRCWSYLDLTGATRLED